VLVEVEESDEERQAALLTRLVQAGVVVSEFRAQAENLEELFLRLTAAE
jgi:ABC-2 type transport system ATP-binding protein